MVWVRMDDGFAENPKIIGLSDSAFRLYVGGLCYAAGHLTDGIVPDAWVGRRERAAAALVLADLWSTTATGYLIHDWDEYNAPADAIKERRRRDRERKRKQQRSPNGQFGSTRNPPGIPPDSTRNPNGILEDSDRPGIPTVPDPEEPPDHLENDPRGGL